MRSARQSKPAPSRTSWVPPSSTKLRTASSSSLVRTCMYAIQCLKPGIAASAVGRRSGVLGGGGVGGEAAHAVERDGVAADTAGGIGRGLFEDRGVVHLQRLALELHGGDLSLVAISRHPVRRQPLHADRAIGVES